MPPVALTIAGSDPSGGAGIQADLKTFHQHGVYGASAITLLTVQNTRLVSAVRVMEPAFVLAQLEAVLADLPPHAAKTGALGTRSIIEALAARAADFAFPLVIDPVMISKHGQALLERDAIDALRSALLPHAFLITPNLAEAAALAGCKVATLDQMKRAAESIGGLGPMHVLIKGGHLSGPQAVDLLWSGGAIKTFVSERLSTQNTHGTGCVFSAAITARLARGEPVIEAVRGAKRFITEAIRTNPGLGGGHGPVNMHVID